MKLLIVDHATVERLLPMTECIDVMASALRALAEGGAEVPLRTLLHVPDGTGGLLVMPGYLSTPSALAVKAVTVYPENLGTALETHQGAVLLFDPTNGVPLAVMDAAAITAVRTAAVSAVATRALARDDAGDLAILGAGTQARTHLEAMRAVRRLRRVRVWSRDPARARRFAEGEGARHGLAIEAASSAEDAIAGADLVCTTTGAHEPVLAGRWLAPGAHVNAVGASVPTARELDAEAVARARFFVDRREAALREAGDFLLARSEGAVSDDHIAGELGDVLLGRVVGRTAPEEVTVFKSLGLAVEDVAAAHHVYVSAGQRGEGHWVKFGGPGDGLADPT